MNKSESALVLLLRFWRELLVSRVKLLAVLVLALLIEGLMLPLIMTTIKPLVDSIMEHKAAEHLFPVAVMLALFFMIKGASFMASRVLTSLLGQQVSAELQSRALAKILRVEGSFFAHHSPGALVERLRGDTQQVQDTATVVISALVKDMAIFIGGLFVAFSMDALWTLYAILGLPLMALPLFLIQKSVRRLSRKSRERAAQVTTRLDESFHNQRTIQLSNAEAYERRRFETRLKEFIKLNVSSAAGLAALPALIDILAGLGAALILVFGGLDVIAGHKSLGEFLTFFAAIGIIFDPLRRISNISGKAQVIAASLERIFNLLDYEPKLVECQEPEIFARPKNDIVFSQIHFSYDPNEPVLRGLSFSVKAGQTTAIVGPSGSGKTTLFALLCRLMDPDSGEITIGGQNIRKLRLYDLRAQIATVSQQSDLFDETLADNIRYANRTANMTEIETAAQFAQLGDVISVSKEGLAMNVGPRGSHLSGGQRQRVTIARALCADKPILLLDEATSALDNQTEARLQTALAKINANRTTLIIAHRLSTVEQADNIIVIDQGQVVQEGKHKELITQEGLYKSLYLA